jgi:syntaxin 16
MTLHVPTMQIYQKIFKFHSLPNYKNYHKHLEKVRVNIYRVNNGDSCWIELQGRETRNKSLLSSTMEVEEDDLDSVFKDAALAVVESNDREIERRNKEINEIVKSVNALAVLFKEIQTMVIDQGTVLDRIDYNIEQVNVYTEGAYEELVKAAKYQDTTKAKVCIVILIVLVFILLMIAIFKPKR